MKEQRTSKTHDFLSTTGGYVDHDEQCGSLTSIGMIHTWERAQTHKFICA